jgi:hypothetical protein
MFQEMDIKRSRSIQRRGGVTKAKRKAERRKEGKKDEKKGNQPSR